MINIAVDRQKFITARRSYASDVSGVAILSVRHTRAF